MPQFVPGIVLCHRFYDDIVRPLFDREFPELHHAAGLIGPGPEVLGFDSEMSTDHCWGPRVQIFLHDDDLDKRRDDILTAFSRHLPKVYSGYPTAFDVPGAAPGDTPSHRVEVLSVDG